MVDAWLLSHSVPSGGGGVGVGGGSGESMDLASPSGGTNQQAGGNGGSSGGVGGSSSMTKSASSGAATPVRKISAHEFERGGLLRPLVSNVDGTLTFISPNEEVPFALVAAGTKPFRLRRNWLKSLDEKELIFELVKDICNDLDVRSLCHKILQVSGDVQRNQ